MRPSYRAAPPHLAVPPYSFVSAEVVTNGVDEFTLPFVGWLDRARRRMFGAAENRCDAPYRTVDGEIECDVECSARRMNVATDRLAPWMARASLQGRIHGVSGATIIRRAERATHLDGAVAINPSRTTDKSRPRSRPR
jgi:hypothetical protein